MQNSGRFKNILAGLVFLALAFFIFQFFGRSKPLTPEDSAPSQTGLSSQSSPATATPSPMPKAPSPDHSTPATSLGELERRYDTQFRLLTTTTGAVFRLSGVVNSEKRQPGSSDTEFAQSFIEEAAPVLGVDHLDQLIPPPNPKVDPLGKTSFFKQAYKDDAGVTVPVYSGLIRVHQDESGNIIMINNDFMTNITGIRNTPSISRDRAIQMAIQHALQFDPQKRTPEVGEASLCIYNFSRIQGPKDLAWKILINQPWLGAKHATGEYFIGAHNDSLLERREKAIE